LTPTDRSPGTPSSDTRFLAAYQAALVIASEIDADAVLQRIVDLARSVVPSRYAALGIADAEGRVQSFITSGISHHERLAIGAIPQGHGLIGELIRHRTPLIVDDIASDPRSAGFPPNHPPMSRLLGVPIELGERVLGNLYLTEPFDNDRYTRDDLETLTVIAAHAAQAIDRAELFARAIESQRRAEEQRDHLEIILNSMASAVLIQSSPDGHVETVNNAARSLLQDMTDLTFSQMQAGKHYAILHMSGRTLPDELWPARRAWRGEMVRNAPHLFVTAAGRQVPVLAQAAPLRDSEGNITRVVSVYQDITRMREADQLKDDFLSLVSHEMRTPLTAIHGGAYLLARQGEEIDEQARQDILTDLVHESERLDRTLSNILTLTAIEAGQMEAETEPLLVTRLIRSRTESISNRFPEFTFTHTLPDRLPPAEGSPELLGHVLDNLYENAMKYSQPGSSIHTEVRAAGDVIRISVTDQGSGIAPEHVPNVFDRFRRPGADPAVRGMGLGLYLSRHLMRVQQGTISASSSGIGRGATFTVTLPISAE
jgi:two-component system, OmpR family, phosphate regulon sensor histidine kinase PhoR